MVIDKRTLADVIGHVNSARQAGRHALHRLSRRRHRVPAVLRRRRRPQAGPGRRQPEAERHVRGAQGGQRARHAAQGGHEADRRQDEDQDQGLRHRSQRADARRARRGLRRQGERHRADPCAGVQVRRQGRDARRAPQPDVRGVAGRREEERRGAREGVQGQVPDGARRSGGRACWRRPRRTTRPTRRSSCTPRPTRSDRRTRRRALARVDAAKRWPSSQGWVVKFAGRQVVGDDYRYEVRAEKGGGDGWRTEIFTIPVPPADDKLIDEREGQARPAGGREMERQEEGHGRPARDEGRSRAHGMVHHRHGRGREGPDQTRPRRTRTGTGRRRSRRPSTPAKPKSKTEALSVRLRRAPRSARSPGP